MNSEFERASALIEHAIAGLSAQDLAWHAEGKWSSAEVLEHLARAFGGTVKGMQRALALPKPECRTMTFLERLKIAVVVHCGYFPPGRKSPEMVVPRGIPAAEAVNFIRANLRAMDEAIVQCEQKFGSRCKIFPHPVLGPLTIPEWRKFHLVHTRHHMRQIARMREQISAARPAAAGSA